MCAAVGVEVNFACYRRVDLSVAEVCVVCLLLSFVSRFSSLLVFPSNQHFTYSFSLCLFIYLSFFFAICTLTFHFPPVNVSRWYSTSIFYFMLSSFPCADSFFSLSLPFSEVLYRYCQFITKILFG